MSGEPGSSQRAHVSGWSRARCPRCGAKTIRLLAKAGISAAEPVSCGECGVKLELGFFWGWVVAVAAPGLFAVLLAVFVYYLDLLIALIVTVILSSVLYLALIALVPMRVARE